MAAEPVTDDIDQVGVFPKYDDVRHIIPGSAMAAGILRPGFRTVFIPEGVRPIVEVAVAPVNAFNDVESYVGCRMVVDRAMGPQFHTQRVITVLTHVRRVAVRDIWGCPTRNARGVPAQVRVYGFMNRGGNAFLIYGLFQLLNGINTVPLCAVSLEGRWMGALPVFGSQR